MPVITRSASQRLISTPVSPSLFLFPHTQNFSRIESWIKGIPDHSSNRASPDENRNFKVVQQPRQRDRKRSNLAPISRNIVQSQKRRDTHDSVIDEEPQAKRLKRMDDTQQPQIAPRRGRSRGQRGISHLVRQDTVSQSTSDNAVLSHPLLSQPSIRSSNSGAPTQSKSNSKSPSKKKKLKRAEDSKSEASIDMQYLETCRPSVSLMDVAQARALGSLPPHVLDLYRRVKDSPSGFIPHELKAAYLNDVNTPRKSQDPPEDHQFLHNHSYPSEQLGSLKRHVDLVVINARLNHRAEAHERQWAAISVVPLITELQTWPVGQGFMLLNVENCSIEPVEIRIERPNGTRLELDSEPSTTSRMIDWTLGLKLDEMNHQRKLIAKAFANMNDYEASMNQSMSYIRESPLFLDLELKKTQSNINPEVQLAIWAAAGFSKKLLHGWDTSMPMPAIAVKGHDWSLYIFFWDGEGLIMMGPLRMGSTANIQGTYEIVYRLHKLIVWGTTVYRKWFKEKILPWCREKSGLGSN